MLKRKPTKRVPLEKKTAQQLIREADKYFSRYVRLRDCEVVDDEFIGECITCSKNGVVAVREGSKFRFIAGWDAGHFVSRGKHKVRYDEQNVNLQCSFRCNRMRSGEYEKYRLSLVDKYGHGTPEELEGLARENPTYYPKKPELLEIIQDSKEQIKYMLENY